jgi:hypothetical protein
MAIFDSLIKPALDSVTTLIGQFHMSPEEKALAQQAVADAAAKAQQAAQDYDTQLNAIAGQNIRAEESSNDKFTVRARPAVVWMGNLLILWNYGIVPVAGAHWHLSPARIPDAFWWTWGTVVTGYVFSRSAEKIAQLPGDSQINLGGILKVGNKN